MLCFGLLGSGMLQCMQAVCACHSSVSVLVCVVKYNPALTLHRASCANTRWSFNGLSAKTI